MAESAVDGSFQCWVYSPPVLVHSVLPHGAFGTYDFAARAAVAGTVASVTTLLLFGPTERWAAR